MLCHDATLIDLEAEAMWPMGTQLEFTITTLFIGLPRLIAVQRCRLADVDLVLRQDGAVWPLNESNWRTRTTPNTRGCRGWSAVFGTRDDYSSPPPARKPRWPLHAMPGPGTTSLRPARTICP